MPGPSHFRVAEQQPRHDAASMEPLPVNTAPPLASVHDVAEVARQVADLGPWYHDILLPGGVRTAPDHPLGDFLLEMWSHISTHVPADLTGATVLDIGCNAGFYSQKLAARGARVLGIDHDVRYLEQARFAAALNGLDIEFRRMEAYDVDRLGARYDYVLFLGVFYHLRHPLYALDRIARVVRHRLVFQSMIRGVPGMIDVPADAGIEDTALFEHPRYPAMYFVERSYAGDATNWWIPNESGMAALLRSAGLEILAHPFNELWICGPAGSGV
jgi:tRNA (mo5U34)-methyltransferase